MARFFGRAVVVCLALVTLGLAGVGAYRSTVAGAPLVSSRGESDDDTITHLEQLELIRNTMAALIPPGSTMSIADASTAYWGQQRLAEFAAMNGIVLVGNGQQAEFTVRLAATKVRPYVRLDVTRTG